MAERSRGGTAPSAPTATATTTAAAAAAAAATGGTSSAGGGLAGLEKELSCPVSSLAL